jgi:hypothetical protein
MIQSTGSAKSLAGPLQAVGDRPPATRCLCIASLNSDNCSMCSMRCSCFRMSSISLSNEISRPGATAAFSTCVAIRKNHTHSGVRGIQLKSSLAIAFASSERKTPARCAKTRYWLDLDDRERCTGMRTGHHRRDFFCFLPRGKLRRLANVWVRPERLGADVFLETRNDLKVKRIASIRRRTIVSHNEHDAPSLQ